ncbi:hypothetical protein LTR62_005025 [Meristemomyces frigidus]|uniref:Enoyl reductase (ER) domain-containing protein n=1 Tax=Meristemomyces frigidus TaxID=1508187 RepID=A0AAN7YS92_9PEZI|nr:hypothetical protein LTR62_005025 [Meristemomyces frigidus]
MSVPSEMKAWRVHIGKPEPFLTEVPVPKPGADELLVTILAAGDCTIMGFSEPLPGWKPEFTLGHEGAGEIVQVGSNVKDGGFAVGDKVTILIVPGCNKPSCPVCSNDMHRICRDPESGNYGLGVDDGFFAEYVTVKARAAVKVPEGIDIAAAAVSADAVLTAYHAVRYIADVQPNQTIAIYGLGGLGLNALQIAQHLGVKQIFVVDKRQETVDAAIKLGVPKERAFCTDDPKATRIEQYVAEKQVNIDTSIDFVGHTDTFHSAQFAVRGGGTMVLVGLISPALQLIPLVSVSKAITIKCHYNGSKKALVECLDLMAKGVIQPKVETDSVQNLPKVLKDLDEGRIKSRMVLLPDWKKT